ncbi:MAG: lysophospholipid acyltransferase family protein [Gammaproteobacteria bacterium]|nr:lysophospholipid acyltransferase family protein [Gammaproteobacteria bacterium]
MLGRFAQLLLIVLARFPRRLCQLLGRLVGLINFLVKTRAYQVTRANLRLCFPDMADVDRETLVKESLLSTGQTLMETPAVWLASEKVLEKWIARVSADNLLNEAVGEGKGVIVLLPHLGNWELFNVYFASRGKMTALYQPPRKAYLQETMKKIRGHFGNELVAANVKGIARLYRVLDKGGVVVILPDQVPATGLYVPFFGIEALTDKLLSRLVRKTDAKVVAACVTRLEDGRFEVGFRAVDGGIYSSDIERSVRAVNATVENCVLEVPAQYQWEYKRFRERPKGEKKIYRFNKPETFH